MSNIRDMILLSLHNLQCVPENIVLTPSWPHDPLTSSSQFSSPLVLDHIAVEASSDTYRQNMLRHLTHITTVILLHRERLSNHRLMSRFVNSYATLNCLIVLFVLDGVMFSISVNLSEISLVFLCDDFFIIKSDYHIFDWC